LAVAFPVAATVVVAAPPLRLALQVPLAGLQLGSLLPQLLLLLLLELLEAGAGAPRVFLERNVFVFFFFDLLFSSRLFLLLLLLLLSPGVKDGGARRRGS